MGKTTSPDPRNRRKKYYWFGVKALFAIGLIGYLLHSGKIDLETLRVTNPSKVVIAQLFWLSAFLLTVLRWRILLIALGIPHRFRDTFRLSGLGLCCSQVIPGATGGDLVRGVQIARESPGKGSNAVMSVLLDRAIGLTALTGIGVAGVFLSPAELRESPLLSRLGFLLSALFATILIVGGLLFWRKLWTDSILYRWISVIPGHRLILRLGEALWQMKRRPRTLVTCFLISIGSHGLFVLTALSLAESLSADISSIGRYFLLVPLGQLAFSLPLTPGGTGVGQWAYGELFQSVGEANGAELATLLQATSAFWAILGAFALFQGGRAIGEIWSAAVEEGEEIEFSRSDPLSSPENETHQPPRDLRSDR